MWDWSQGPMEKYLFDTTIIRLSDHERFHICLLLTFVNCSSSCLFAFFRCNYFVVSDFSFLFTGWHNNSNKFTLLSTDSVKETILLIRASYILLVFLSLRGRFLSNIANLFGFCHFRLCSGFVSFIFVTGEGLREANAHLLKSPNPVTVMPSVFNLRSFLMDFWNIGWK